MRLCKSEISDNRQRESDHCIAPSDLAKTHRPLTVTKSKVKRKKTFYIHLVLLVSK